MSELKVNKISPRSGTAFTLGDSGDTFTIPSGATINNQGTAVNFGATGSASWVTTVKTGDFTAVAGEGYFVNTTSGAITVTLPASPAAGAVVAIKDYANTFDTNNCTLGRNGSNIGGNALNSILSTEGLAVTLVFVDATKGWLVTDSGLQSEAPGPTFVTASGGNATAICGNFKTHIFTGPGTFCVSAVGNPAGSSTVDYLVVAGGGGGGSSAASGGGAGGFRISNSYSIPAPTMSPLSNPTGLPVSVQGYTIAIGGGGPAGSLPNGNGTTGSVSTFSTISSAGGGGGRGSGNGTGFDGASGGGGKGGPSGTSGYCGGAGNTPPVSPPQGNNGGKGYDGTTLSTNGGGGGGAGVGGSNAACSTGGVGGAGSFIADGFINPTSPSYGTPGPVSSTRYFSGGGGGTTCGGPGGQPVTFGVGGAGGGGSGGGAGTGPAGGAGTVNTGGGGGGGVGNSNSPGGVGGSGIVMIRYRFQ